MDKEQREINREGWRDFCEAIVTCVLLATAAIFICWLIGWTPGY